MKSPTIKSKSKSMLNFFINKISNDNYYREEKTFNNINN